MTNLESALIDFIFVGPQRTGTTWIYEHLLHHPGICFPKGVKETMFFDRNFEKGMEWYTWHFSECKSTKKCGEVSPSYFDNPKVPVRIREDYPDSKIIISLRDPVEKAWSLYQHHYQKGRVKGSFFEAIEIMPEILTSGYYAEHINRWYANFEEDQILIISMNDIKNRPNLLLEELCKFLAIEKDLLQDSVEKGKVNTARQPRHSGLAKAGSDLVSKLHENRLHLVVNFAKKLGLKKVFFKKSSQKPGLTEKEKTFLKNKYAPHIDYVNEKFERITL